MSYSYDTNEYEFCGFRLPCGICRMTNLECSKLNKPSKPNYTINVSGTTSPNGYVYKQSTKVEDSNND